MYIIYRYQRINLLKKINFFQGITLSLAVLILIKWAYLTFIKRSSALQMKIFLLKSVIDGKKWPPYHQVIMMYPYHFPFIIISLMILQSNKSILCIEKIAHMRNYRTLLSKALLPVPFVKTSQTALNTCH